MFRTGYVMLLRLVQFEDPHNTVLQTKTMRNGDDMYY